MDIVTLTQEQTTSDELITFSKVVFKIRSLPNRIIYSSLAAVVVLANTAGFFALNAAVSLYHG